jgi:hypothetical protein
MEHLDEKVAAHDATLTQMNERLGNIESRLNRMENRLDTRMNTIAAWLVTLENCLLGATLGVRAFLGGLMTMCKFW